MRAIGMNTNDPLGIPNLWRVGMKGQNLHGKERHAGSVSAGKLGFNEKGSDKETRVLFGL